MKKVIESGLVPKAVGPYSQAISIDGFLFCSGQIPIDPETGIMVEQDIVKQTHQVIKNITYVLQAAEMELSDVIKATVFLTDMNNFAAVNEIYGKYFSVNPPARSCVEVSKLPKDALVEIEVVARR